MLIKASLSLLLNSSRPSGLSPSLWLIWFPPKSDPFGQQPPRAGSGRCPELPPPPPTTRPHPPPGATGTLAGLPVPSPTPALLIGYPRTCLRISPCHTQPWDHSLPQLPNHTYLFPPSLPLPRFCLVTERHLGTLPRLELASCTVPRNLRQSGRAARLPGYAWQTTH